MMGAVTPETQEGGINMTRYLSHALGKEFTREEQIADFVAYVLENEDDPEVVDGLTFTQYISDMVENGYISVIPEEEVASSSPG
jgi:hypothetical protein